MADSSGYFSQMDDKDQEIARLHEQMNQDRQAFERELRRMRQPVGRVVMKRADGHFDVLSILAVRSLGEALEVEVEAP